MVDEKEREELLIRGRRQGLAAAAKEVAELSDCFRSTRQRKAAGLADTTQLAIERIDPAKIQPAINAAEERGDLDLALAAYLALYKFAEEHCGPLSANAAEWLSCDQPERVWYLLQSRKAAGLPKRTDPKDPDQRRDPWSRARRNPPILLIFEMVPDESNVYLFEAPTDEEAALLKANHGVWGNLAGLTDAQNEANNKLCELLTDRETVNLAPGEPIQVTGVTVVVAGFML